MRRSLLRASLLAAALAACADDSSTITETHAPNGATIIGGRDPLTPPSSAPRDVIIREFLKTRGAGSAVDQLRVVRESSPVNGIVHVTMEQFADGLRIYDAYVKAAINSQGQLIQVIDNVVRPKPTASPLTISEAAALDAARAELGYDATIALYRAPRIERVAYIDDNGTLREGYVVETWTLADNKLDETLVGHNGHVVAVQARSASDSYNVFVEDPGKNVQTVVGGGAGWLFAGDQSSQHIRGNNVSAYVDADANNAPDSGGSTVTDGNFLAAADFSSSPGTANNKDVAVQNLFYLNNVAHDVLYAAGFNEAEGNFQQDNFGLGGAGNDAVKAEAQDGSGTDNANFSTPSDGSAPRMQMYLWSPLGTHEVITAGGTYAAAGAAFGPALTTTGMSGDVVGVSTDGCGAVSGVSGKIALIDRGNCDFTVKVMNAQTAGATAVIIANNAGDSMFEMGGNNRKIKIPSVMVGQTSGAALRAAPSAATLRKDPTPPPMVDADLDSDIVFHEYGHGLSWRMIGGMSGPMSGAIGEGASDTLAFLINGDSAVAEYSASDPRGIRRFVYEGYPNTYSDMCAGGCQVHNDGEIYAAAMWRLRSLYVANGLSSETLLGDWVQGMRYTPASPAFENMRDGLVQALSVSAPERTCLVWQAFAAQGIGVGAKGVLGKGGRTVVVTESFAVPAECAAP